MSSLVGLVTLAPCWVAAVGSGVANPAFDVTIHALGSAAILLLLHARRLEHWVHGHVDRPVTRRGPDVGVDVTSVHSHAAAVEPQLSLGKQIWHFTRHYLEMCAAMCLGGTALNLLVFVAGPTVVGYPDLRHDAPAAALVLAAVLYTLPMTVWMRIRHMAWRPTIEMSAASVVVAVVVAALFGIGVISRTGLDAWLAAGCSPWCVVMFVPMLFRLPLYTGRSGHGHRHG